MRTGTTALVLLFGLVACAADPSATTGGDDSTTSPPTSAATASMAGTYECGLPGSSEPGNIYEFAEDGTLTITRADGVPEPSGTWSVDGDQGIIATPDFDEPFTVVDGGFVFGDGSECTKTG